jgi:hypothetical protein
MLTLRLLALSFIVLLSGCIIIPTYNTSISLKSSDQNEQGIPINNVLLIGTGTMASQIFLDNLSTELIRSFKAKSITADYSYKGKVPDLLTLKIDSLVTDQYDTYIVFKSINNSLLDMDKVKYAAVGPGTYGTGYGNQYAEKFTIMLYTKKEKPELLWQGHLDVDFDLANDTRYKKIARLLMNELAKNHFVKK